MKIATWNVNSIRQREGHVRRWLERTSPDILLMQELKCEAPNFPREGFEALGYSAAVVGQKAYNGVAALARVPVSVTHTALPGLGPEDSQARYIELEADGLVVIGIYLPNGNSGGEAGFAYKLAWMDALHRRVAGLIEADRDVVVTGDFNVCPTDEDFAPGTLPRGDALVHPDSRARFRGLLWLGLTDAIRAVRPSGPVWTFWDYQAGAWQRNLGLRIDHALLSARPAERLRDATVDRHERGEEQPSDHVPVTVELG